MGKTADLTVVQMTIIDTLHKEGKTQKVIAKEAGCSQSSVSKHINREAKGRKRCGRKKCTSNRDNRTLERIVKQNPFKNVWEIHKEWTAAGVSASRTTTHRRMQDMGFSCRIPCVKPLLNNRQRQKRLAWAKDKKDWTAAEWSKVMFSDESKFCISFGNQGPRVWRKRGEAQNPRCLRSSVNFPQSVMVWGAMSSAGVGPLCFLRSKVNTAVYQEVLEHFMLLRFASGRRLVVPSQRDTKSLSRTFSFTVPGWWNDLPPPIRNTGSLSIFKQQLKTHLFQHYLT